QLLTPPLPSRRSSDLPAQPRRASQAVRSCARTGDEQRPAGEVAASGVFDPSRIASEGDGQTVPSYGDRASDSQPMTVTTITDAQDRKSTRLNSSDEGI